MRRRGWLGTGSALRWTMGFALLAMAWALANPLGASPDERSHYVKAIGAVLGQGDGTPRTVVPAPDAPAVERLLARLDGTYQLPSDLAPDPRWECTRKTGAAAHCLTRPVSPDRITPEFTADLKQTQMAKYPAAPYFVLGAVARWMSSASRAMYAGRLTGALVVAALLGAAIAITDRGWGRAGVLAAASPMVVFLAGSLTTSGIETGAGIAQAASILALGNGTRRPAVWAVYAISGATLALARPSGMFFVVMYAGFGLLLLGTRRAASLVREQGSGAVIAVGTVAISLVIATLWNLLVVPQTAVSAGEALSNLASSAGRSLSGAGQFVGRFGWLDTSMPRVAYVVAAAVYLALFAGALRIGTKKDRGLLLVAIALTAAANVMLDAATQAPYGFRFQARFCLPFVVLVPMLCGATIGRRRNPEVAITRPRRLESGALLGSSLVLVVIEALAWWTNSRQSAVGVHGPWLFLAGGAWAPPIGWVTPIALFVVAIGLLTTAAVANAGGIGGELRPGPSARIRVGDRRGTANHALSRNGG